MRKKFKIFLPDGTKYKPPKDSFVAMSDQGIFFLVTIPKDWYTYVRPLHKEVPKCDVVWNNEKENTNE